MADWRSVEALLGTPPSAALLASKERSGALQLPGVGAARRPWTRQKNRESEQRSAGQCAQCRVHEGHLTTCPNFRRFRALSEKSLLATAEPKVKVFCCCSRCLLISNGAFACRLSLCWPEIIASWQRER